jgi:8-oxo-dGTP diphosphatase
VTNSRPTRERPPAAVRSPSLDRPVTRRAALSVDVVLVTTNERQLSVLLRRAARARDKLELPWDVARADESLDEAAARVARIAMGSSPAWLHQVETFGGEHRHPGGADFSVAYLAVVSQGTPVLPGSPGEWFALDDLPPLPPRHRTMIDRAREALREQLDQAPIAFRLLPPIFTLSQLQEIYEVLLGRPLHKASFRRALHAAWLVEPTEEWRSEGRGRPAQLFRFAPRRRRGARRGVRFDLVLREAMEGPRGRSA